MDLAANNVAINFMEQTGSNSSVLDAERESMRRDHLSQLLTRLKTIGAIQVRHLALTAGELILVSRVLSEV